VIAAVVLAGGEGRRYGGLKQLHDVDGRPMLERVLGTVAAAGPEHRVVVLGARAGTILERVDLHGARPVVCDRWDAGQAASLHAGLDALPDEAEWALVVLGDGPGLDPRAVERMLAAADPGADAIRAADYGQGRSHPVLIPRSRFGEIPARGERPVRGLPAEAVDCRGLQPPGDVDYA
jgi:CTP:molybdopterin cytidylyltransferase MocA